MTILWCGGEDVDFPFGEAVTTYTNPAGSPVYRTGFARCAVGDSTAASSSRSLSFVGGAVTSAWLHFEAYVLVAGASAPFAGFGLNSFGDGGVYVGTSTVAAAKCGLYKWDGVTLTQLATELGTSLPGISNGGLVAIDMQISSYGATSTVNVYVHNVLVITFTGSTAIAGISNLDCVSIYGSPSISTKVYPLSEFIVGDADTRSMSLLTMAPNAAGDVNNWTTGTYANINPTTINDASVIAVNTTGQDFQANLIDLPAGSFGNVQAVKAAVRAEVTAGSTPTSLKIGVKTSSTVNVDSGRSLTTGFLTYERLMLTNPVTTNPWLASEMNPLQMDLQSA